MADTFTVERRTHIDAPAATIYPHLANFRALQGWSPWEGVDPNLERTYSGAEQGVGAQYAWKGNRKAGQGEMTITEATGDRVVLDLQFLKPFKQLNTTIFTLTPADGGTDVTWTMTGPTNLFSKIMGIFKSLDAMIGPDFEKGLAALKELAETGTAVTGAAPQQGAPAVS